MEKFGVGGALTVRGYRENQFVRDNGMVASMELRFPLDLIGHSPKWGALQFATFFDWGRSWNRGDSRIGAATISSAGVGFRWDPSQKLHAEVYWAHPFKDVDVIDASINTLQDEGVTFLINYSVF